MTIQVKATEQYFPVVLFIMLYKVILTFESVDEILKCDNPKESYFPDCCLLFNILLSSSRKLWKFDKIVFFFFTKLLVLLDGIYLMEDHRCDRSSRVMSMGRQLRLQVL